MAEGIVETATPSAWLPPDREARLYEAIRHGDEAAFRAVAEPLQPVLRRLAGLTQPDPDDIDVMVARSWRLALRALDRFCWHTSLATWVAHITVIQGRAHAAADLPAAPAPPVSPRTRSGPADWSDLPWSSRWDGILPVLRAQLRALPLPEREVVHAHDVEGWPRRRVCDVLGLPEVVQARLLAEGRQTLRDALARSVGQTGTAHRTAQAEHVAATLPVLIWSADLDLPRLDRRTVQAFRQWRPERVTGWRRALPRVAVRTRPFQDSACGDSRL